MKKSELQVKNISTNLRKNIISQEEKLEERIKNRKICSADPKKVIFLDNFSLALRASLIKEDEE